jgi:antitoxin (DNA-binding transcriptional repressor) of toxin-antitoxin stability system
MALKADRYELQTDISFFYNAGIATRGGVVCHDTAGSGAAMDQGVNLVKYSTSGTPVGILLNDVVNKDLTRTHLNQYKDEVQKGGKVTVLRKGYVVTNLVDTVQPPIAGSGAYRSTVNAGNISIVASGDKIGNFLTSRDADGYCKVEVSLP